MTHYGQEIETKYPAADMQIDVIRNYNHSEIKSVFKRVIVRIKVDSKAREREEYENFSKLIDDKRAQGALAPRPRGSSDTSLLPSFTIEHPKVDIDGCYFVITTYTELML